MQLPVMPPVSPMLAKSVKEIPRGDFSYEPKWDGFRSIIFRDGDEVEIGSRNEKPMTRYFPEVVEAVLANFPERGGDRRRDHRDRGQRRPAGVRDPAAAHPPRGQPGHHALGRRHRPGSSPSTCSRWATTTTPAGRSPNGARRWSRRSADAQAPIHLTPVTRDPALAQDWFSQFEGAGLDGVVAKPLATGYQPDKRVMFKIKHERTADCVVAGYRVHKSGPDSIGSLLLGLYNDDGDLASVGVIGAFPLARRKELFAELQPMVTTFDDHPWAWAKQEEGARTPRNSECSRWNVGKDLSFVPLRPELVVEVRYEHMEGVRFRHTAQFNRWRPDRDPRSCTYEQLEEPVKFDLADVLADA